MDNDDIVEIKRVKIEQGKPGSSRKPIMISEVSPSRSTQCKAFQADQQDTRPARKASGSGVIDLTSE